MTEPTLHPNLAKLAGAYDEILERLSRGQISTVAARAEIAQLEARDDEGVRWNIDPDSGEWVRKTALGDYEYDAAPPTYGYMTPDAFDYTANPQVFNPSDRLQMAAVNEQLESAPSSLTGATRTRTRSGTQTGWRTRLEQVIARVAVLPAAAKVVAALAALALLALLLHSCGAGEDTAPTPDKPGSSSTPHPTPKAHHKVKRHGAVRTHH